MDNVFASRSDDVHTHTKRSLLHKHGKHECILCLPSDKGFLRHVAMCAALKRNSEAVDGTIYLVRSLWELLHYCCLVSIAYRHPGLLYVR